MSARRRIQGGLSCLATLVFVALLWVDPAAAQVVSNGAEANETVQLVKSSLMAIAIALLVLTIFYWIHTDPKRRARAQTKKLARKEAFAKRQQSDAEPVDDDDSGVVVDGEAEEAGSILVLDADSDADDLALEDDFQLPDVEREVS